MRVSVRLYGEASSLVGQSELWLELPEPGDLRALLSEMDRYSQSPVSKTLIEGGCDSEGGERIWSGVAILLNGGNVVLGDGLDTPLEEGDNITILSLVAGG